MEKPNNRLVLTSPDYEWGGPFIKRTDSDGLRPAAWVNCAYCKKMVLRSLTELKTSPPDTAIFCTNAHASKSKRKLYAKNCARCGREFTFLSEDRSRRYCSPKCAGMIMGQIQARVRNIATVAYFETRELPVDKNLLRCDLCGRPQRWTGRKKPHSYVRVTCLNGNGHDVRPENLIAICKVCYEHRRKSVDKPQQPVLQSGAQVIKETSA